MIQKDLTNSMENINTKKDIDTIGFILCHPMNNSLTPIIDELPPCLFPLCNTPVILYVLNWFKINNIEKVYIVCDSKHAPFLKKYKEQCQARMLMDSITILDTEAKIYNIGDALRWIDRWNQNNHSYQHCLIVPGTLVTNIPVKDIIRDHQERYNKAPHQDKPLLTACFAHSSDRIGFSMVSNESGMILQFRSPKEMQLDQNEDNDSLMLNPDYISSQKRINIRTGINDAHIYICTSQLLNDFSKHPEWSDVCHNCIRSQLNHSKHCHSFYSAVIPNTFSVTIDTLPNYLLASQAIMQRWLYPVTIEMNIFAQNETHSQLTEQYNDIIEFNESDYDMIKSSSDGYEDDNDSEPQLDDTIKAGLAFQNQAGDSTFYRLERDLVYLYNNVFPNMKSEIGTSVIGCNSELQEGCVIKNSVIGSQCVIKKNAVIIDSIIWDNVIINENAQIKSSLIGSDVTIESSVSIDLGCIISFGVNCEIDLPPCRRLKAKNIEEDEVRQNASKEDCIPAWLKDYCEHKSLLSIPDQMNSIEFIPNPRDEFPSLKMWYQDNPSHFPIDIHAMIHKSESQSSVAPIRSSSSFLSAFSSCEDIKNMSDAEKEEEDFLDEQSYDEFAFNPDEDFIHLNQDFQHKASTFLNSLITDDLEPDEINEAFRNFVQQEKGDPINSAVAIMHAIDNNWTEDLIEHGINLFEHQIRTFLKDSEIQVDFLFWWQSYCAKNQIDDDFLTALNIFVEKNIIHKIALERWGKEQYECTPEQNNLYDLFTTQDNIVMT